MADRGYRLGEDKITRNCKIPEGWSILLLMSGGEVTHLEYPRQDADQLLRRYVEYNYVSHLTVKIDGNSYRQDYFDENKYNIIATNFDLAYGDDNIFGVRGGQRAKAASRGYWLFLNQTPREFTLEVQQTTEPDPLINSEKFSYSLTYNISRT